MAWCAVVKYHGPKPTAGANKVWVANHTSMIDYAILCSHSPFAVIMQVSGCLFLCVGVGGEVGAAEDVFVCVRILGRNERVFVCVERGGSVCA
jgi:hypothetical protein